MLASASLGLLSSVFFCSVHVVQAMDNTCYFTEAQNVNLSQNLNLNNLSVEQACMNQNEYNEFNESACMLAGIDARKKACEDTDGLGVVYVDYMVYSKNCPDRGEGLIGPNGETCQPANCTSDDFRILAYDEFPDGCTVGEIDIDLYAGTMNPYPELEDEEENDYDETNEKPDFDFDSDERNKCTITDGINMALMSQFLKEASGASEFVSNCMGEGTAMTEECAMESFNIHNKACASTEGLTVRNVDFRVVSMDDGDNVNCQMQMQSVMIGPNGETCQPTNCTPDDFMDLVKGQFAEECDVQIYLVNQRGPELEPEPEPEPEKPDSDSDVTNTCTITDGLNMALMNDVQNGPSFQFISNCMENMTKECEMGMLKMYSEACASTEGLTVRHVDFRVVSMNSEEHCQVQSEMIGPDGITCQPINCTPEDFMELVKEKFAEDCDVQVYVVNQHGPEPELEPEPEPEPELEPESDGDVDSESDSESFMCKDNAGFRHIKEEMPNKKITCRNIGKKNNRRKKFCKDQDVNNACPQTCGTCCVNAPMEEFKFTVNNNKKNRTMRKGCDWLGDQSEKRLNKYCKKKPVRAACAVSCNSCMEEIKANL